MKQDDYFLNQIDLLGRVLGKVLANLLNLSNKGEVLEGMNNVNEVLKNQLDMNLNDFLSLNSETLITYLKSEKKLSDVHLEILAEIVYTLGLNSNTDTAQNYIEKGLVLYSHINAVSTTYCTERIAKMDKLRMMLN
jgi:hypothetical protein